MKLFHGLLVCIFLLAVCGLGCEQSGETRAGEPAAEAPLAAEPQAPASTRFRFNYCFELVGLTPDSTVCVWIPVPKSTKYQEVSALDPVLPGEPRQSQDSGISQNQMYFLELTAPEEGTFRFELPYDVQRQEIRALEEEPAIRPLGEAERELLLAPDSQVPTSGEPLKLLADIELSDDPLTLARQIYDVVGEHVTYNKDGEGWGNGDVLWVCESGRGNCTDFHSLFLSLARAQGLPCEFEMGFPIPVQEGMADETTGGPIGGYHCWAWVYLDDRRLIPVDISEADKHPEMADYFFGNLPPDRVGFSFGRDIALDPAPAAGLLNYFIYPHIEVDGEPLPAEQLKLDFSWSPSAE